MTLLHTTFPLAICLSFVANFPIFSNGINISGKVVDSQDFAVEGVNVRLMLIGDSAITDKNGNFSIISSGIIVPKKRNINTIYNPEYSNITGILSFSVLKNFQPVIIDIYSINGKKTGSVLNTILDIGIYHINPLSYINKSLNSSLNFIRLRCGNNNYVFKAIGVKNRKNALDLQKNIISGNILTKKTAVKDTLLFYKNGYQTKKLQIDTLEKNLGSVTILGFPSCKTTTPSNESNFKFGDSVYIIVEASDIDGNIVSVDLYVDNELQNRDNVQPFEYTWNSVRNTIGTRFVRAIAEDNDSLIKTDSITINITADGIRTFKYNIINTYNHDPESFTQGLVYEDGFLFEGTGLNGQSSLRKVELETGEVVSIHNLAGDYFGEGITIYQNNIIQLTWQEHTGFVYDKSSFEEIQTFSYTTEGWGITHNSEKLIMSDGTSFLYFLDTNTYKEIGKINVTENDTPITNLNELEFFYNKVFANVWQTDYIVMIDLESGNVIGRIDLEGLLTPEEYSQADVLNGIAYDNIKDRIFVTGKLWPKLFEIELVLEE